MLAVVMFLALIGCWGRSLDITKMAAHGYALANPGDAVFVISVVMIAMGRKRGAGTMHQRITRRRSLRLAGGGRRALVRVRSGDGLDLLFGSGRGQGRRGGMQLEAVVDGSSLLCGCNSGVYRLLQGAILAALLSERGERDTARALDRIAGRGQTI